MRSTTIVALLVVCTLLGYAVAQGPGVNTFTLVPPGSTPAPWSARFAAYATIVQVPTSAGLTYEPLIVGGIGSNGYEPDAWRGNGVASGGGWSSLNNPPFSARAGGGMFTVMLPGNVQIVLLAGGQNSSTEYNNEIWYSLDTGGSWAQFPQNNIQFSPRAQFGFQIANAFNDSTVYGYLVGGITASGPSNDFFYSIGRGTTNPWTPVPAQYGGKAPWAPRYAFGCTTYDNMNGLVVAGGTGSNGQTFNDVWIWNLNGWSEVPAGDYYSPLNFQRSLTGTNTYYILGGTDQQQGTIKQVSSGSTPNIENFQVVQGSTTPNPYRVDQVCPITPNSVVYSLGGVTSGLAPTNDVWFAQLK